MRRHDDTLGPAARRVCDGNGLSLVEVLVALAILALALLAWVSVTGALARAERASEVRRELAAWMRNELRLQRSARALVCLAEPPSPSWSCRVERSCVGGTPPCEVEAVHVVMVPPDGPGLAGTTAVWWPLQRAAVSGAGP